MTEISKVIKCPKKNPEISNRCLVKYINTLLTHSTKLVIFNYHCVPGNVTTV